MNYRLGFDLGAGSIGWCILELDADSAPCSLVDMGVRIASDGRDPQTKSPLAVSRRMARGMSRNRDRRVMRREALLKALVRFGLMPADKAAAAGVAAGNPYKFRHDGVHEKIELFDLGRAIFHISKRRGFKSNRKTDSRDSESSSMKAGIERLRGILAGRTLGEYLYERLRSNEGTRMRARLIKAKNEYEIYADRKMYEEEFDRLWSVQAGFHPELTDAARDAIRRIVFFQRPLKVPERGKCRFEPSLERAYAAYPISQAFRIWQEVANLEIVSLGGDSPALSREDRDKLADELLFNRSKKANKAGLLTFSNIRKILGLKSVEFNLEDGVRKGLYIDRVDAAMSAPEVFGPRWREMPDADREAFVDFLSSHGDGESASWLREKFGVSEEAAENVLDAFQLLPAGTVSLSAAAMRKILPFMKDGALYHNACALAGYAFNSFGSETRLERLPYYGEILKAAAIGADPSADPVKEPELHFGRIANPTVHLMLNQLRRLVNGIIETYGAPAEIIVESARDLPLGEKGLAELKANIAKNRRRNEEIAAELEKCGVENNYENRMKYRVWENMNPDSLERRCPFCGRPVSLHELFTPAFEIEHLLPYSRTFDDGISNKVISCARCNRHKRNRTPFEAFGHNPEGWSWDDICARASLLPKSSQWRFEPDAIEKFSENGGDMIARMLNDTRYISKIAREYLSAVADPMKIWAVNGRITSLLRGKWHLNEILNPANLLSGEERGVKNRNDSRHHAIDAFVIACAGHSTIRRISECAKLAEEAGLQKLVSALGDPFPGFSYGDFDRMVSKILVSHKPDRGNARGAVSKNKTLGKLHNETAMGMVGAPDASGNAMFAKRVMLDSIEPREKNVNEIANLKVREDLLKILEEAKKSVSGEPALRRLWLEKLGQYSSANGVRRVRIHVPRAISKVIGIKDKSGKAYKYMDNAENYCIDIYIPSGSEKWNFHIVSMFAAHSAAETPPWRKNDPHAKLVMRLFKNDIVAYEKDGETKIDRVVGIASQGPISFIPVNMSKWDGTNPPRIRPSSLQNLNARKVYIDELGRLFDPGKSRYSE